MDASGIYVATELPVGFYTAERQRVKVDDASNGFCSYTAGVSLPQNSFDTRAEKAVSGFNQRRRFTVKFVYDLDAVAPSTRAIRAEVGVLGPLKPDLPCRMGA
jgi:hypothetical protein